MSRWTSHSLCAVICRTGLRMTSRAFSGFLVFSSLRHFSQELCRTLHDDTQFRSTCFLSTLRLVTVAVIKIPNIIKMCFPCWQTTGAEAMRHLGLWYLDESEQSPIAYWFQNISITLQNCSEILHALWIVYAHGVSPQHTTRSLQSRCHRKTEYDSSAWCGFYLGYDRQRLDVAFDKVIEL